MTTTHLLYLHGFRSSPGSTKARLVQDRMARGHPAVRLWCPQLPPSPRQAIEQVVHGIAGWPRATMAVVGSSLGGYYATWLAEQTGCRAVLLNPAVHAARDLATRVGIHTGWHEPEKPFEFKAAYLDELRALAVAAITVPRRYYTLIAKGDEVLDWREMSAHYPGTAGRLLEGSDHALTEFAAYLDEILSFLELDPQPAA
ncbi:MAG: YqiA/YcfP family alpha/beta fold hydrolase [Curvibacter sp.]|jgi:predicted esterase YcpF (UPF0227 family)|nr:esterase [Curvibacter sp.]